VFFAFVIDVYSRRVVGWQLAPHMRTTLVLDALRMALSRRQGGADVELVPHSDAGSTPLRLHPGARHPRRARVDRLGRRRSGQRAGRELRRVLKAELMADRVWRTRPSSSSRWSNTWAGSTTAGCTRRSARSRRSTSSTRTLPGPRFRATDRVAGPGRRAADRLYAPRARARKCQTPCTSTLGESASRGRRRRQHPLEGRNHQQGLRGIGPGSDLCLSLPH
jgi:transposase InsO family protein